MSLSASVSSLFQIVFTPYTTIGPEVSAALVRPEPIATMAADLRARGYRLEIEESEDRVVSMRVENCVEDDAPPVASRQVAVSVWLSKTVDDLIAEAYQKVMGA